MVSTGFSLFGGENTFHTFVYPCENGQSSPPSTKASLCKYFEFVRYLEPRLFKTAGRSTFRPVYKHELNSHDWRKGDSRLKALFQSRPFFTILLDCPFDRLAAIVRP